MKEGYLYRTPEVRGSHSNFPPLATNISELRGRGFSCERWADRVGWQDVDKYLGNNLGGQYRGGVIVRDEPFLNIRF